MIRQELRIGDTRRTVGRTAAQLLTSAGDALSIPGIPSNAKFPNTLPTFLIGGCQQLGSPQNTASDFRTSVSEVADALTWLRGRHTLKMGLDWRWERLNVVQPPYPTGSFMFNAIGSDLPGVANTGTPLASFLLGVVWDLPAGAGRARQLHGVLGAIANDWTVTTLVTLQSGVPVAVTQTTNFNAFAGFGVQFTVGSASRNPVRGPSYRTVDLALIRRVPVHAGASLEVRAEVFNLLKTSNFGAPNAVLGAANFGTITTAFDPRVVQLALKFVF